jgi:hypothetical protein
MGAWEEALNALPAEVRNAVVSDGYPSATIFASCFRSEEQLDKYACGLYLVRKVSSLDNMRTWP